ncbi:MAG TPA: AIPR family protein [Syntrophales bacterium]|nr:AIPR family protein [Syntrophales bacterium]
MDIEEFRKDFLETVKSHAAAEGDITHAAFVTIVSEKLMDAEELSDFEHCYHEGNGVKDRRLKLGIDGYSFDESDDSLKLLIVDFRGGAVAETLTQTDASTMFSRLTAFITEAMSGMLHPQLEDSSPARALATEIFRNQQAIARLRLYLATDAVLSSRVKDWPERIINDKPFEFHIWDAARFHRAFEAATGRDELKIDFREFMPEGIPCLEASQTGDEYKAYLCVIPATVLADLYDRYGSRLLERNVRSFLGIRGAKSVNSGIRSTILSQPSMFFAFNNGIAVTASTVEVARGGNGLGILCADDLQIVNGGQTTASLTTAKRKDRAELKDIFVQMKLSVIGPERADELIPQISRSANSQNKVSEADFFSNHPFHRRIETHSRHLWAPAVAGAQHETHWFYERARGQFLNEQVRMTPSEKRRFLQQNPREQLITKTDLAKYENAWREIPHVISLGAQKNFRDFAGHIDELWKASDSEFNEEYFKNIVARAIIWKYTERMVSRQPWYQGGYRANVVAYSIAKLAMMIRTSAGGRVLDFRAIWGKQGISKAMELQLEQIAEAVFNTIVSEDRLVDNVTEWCKKKLCWERVESIKVPLLSSFVADLVDKAELLTVKKDAKKLQKTDNGIAAQAEVVQLGGKYWQQISNWAEKKNLLTPDEKKIVSIAARIPNRIPPDFQCPKLLEIRSRMIAEGFGYP